jgi:hypothetical protein
LFFHPQNNNLPPDPAPDSLKIRNEKIEFARQLTGDGYIAARQVLPGTKKKQQQQLK